MANENPKATPPATKKDDDVLVTMSRAELQRMIEDAVLSFAEKPRAQALDENVLGKVIGDAVATGMQRNQRPKITIAQYLKKPHSIFHPNGPGPALRRRSFQNNTPLNAATLTDQEITLLNAISHSGRYIHRLVEVEVRPEGSEDVVYVRFNNRTPDQVLELKGHIRNFEHMLQVVVDEQAKEVEEREIQEDIMREQRRKVLAAREARAAATALAKE